jgi:hypothetical protein
MCLLQNLVVRAPYDKISAHKYCCIDVKYYNILEYDQTSPLTRTSPPPNLSTQKKNHSRRRLNSSLPQIALPILRTIIILQRALSVVIYLYTIFYYYYYYYFCGIVLLLLLVLFLKHTI